MAKNNKKPTKETIEMEKSDEILTAVPNKKKAKEDKSQKVDQKKLKQGKKKTNDKPKRNRVKEITSELKKVNWPSFKNACKQTGSILVVVGIFTLAVLGIDTLVAALIDLIAKI